MFSFDIILRESQHECLSLTCKQTQARIILNSSKLYILQSIERSKKTDSITKIFN